MEILGILFFIGIIMGLLYKTKGRSFALGFLATLFLSPFGALILFIFLKNMKKEKAK